MRRRKTATLMLTGVCIFWTLSFLNTFRQHLQIVNRISGQESFAQGHINRTKFWENMFPKKLNTVGRIKETTTVGRIKETTHQFTLPVLDRKDKCQETLNHDFTSGTSTHVPNLHLELHPMLSKFSSFYENGGIDGKLLLHGHQRNKRGFLTLGIPTVRRRFNDYYYLNYTVTELIDKIDQKMIADVVIVIFMADFNISWNLRTAKKLHETFQPHFDSGLVQVIHAPPNIYPQLSLLIKKGPDSLERIKWRSKQNVDFAILMLYSISLSTYYMQLEDDLMVAPDYLQDMQSFINKQRTCWFNLEFSTLGFIGKLFHSYHLFSIASHLLKNFQERPCDLMLGALRNQFGQKKVLFSGRSIFQHIGKISTLKDKMMPAVDKKFKTFGSNVPLIMVLPEGGERPNATFNTNMRIVSGFPPENVYKKDSYFVTNFVKTRQYFRIVFESHYNISRLLISTGNFRKSNILVHGFLKIGANGHGCESVINVGKFVDGEIDTLIQGFKLPHNVNCVHIEVARFQKTPLIIRDFKVFLDKT